MSTDESVSLRLQRTHSEKSLREALAGPFTAKSDLSYRTLSNLNVTAQDLYQSLLTGSIIKDCHFGATRFARCDLDGMRIERSTFVDCEFTSCDIRSSHFIECRFEACKFDEAMIHECEFIESEFLNSSFTSASLLRCRFYRSKLGDCLLARGTFLHNKFYQTGIADTVLGDCTFLYAIFRECSLERVTVNVESLGSILGMSRNQLEQVDLIYLGQGQAFPDNSDVVTLLLNEYASRHWDMGRLVLTLNFELLSTVAAVESYLVDSLRRFRTVGFVKEEELQFLGDILQELTALKRGPLLALFNVLEWCTASETILVSNPTGDRASSCESIRALAGRIGLMVNDQMEKFDQEVSNSWDFADTATLRFSITFAEKPSVSIVDIINDLTEALSVIGNRSPAHLIESRTGSYIEVLAASVMSIYAFQVFLFLLNGCIIQITELKHRLKVLTQASSPKQYAVIALSPKQNASPALLSLLPTLLKYAKGLGWVSQPSLAGLAATNVKSLNIDEHIPK